VVQSTNIEGAAGEGQVLQAEAPVFSGDRILTDATGEVQIRFRDDTRLVVGPNSSIVIDQFVFAGDSSLQVASISALRGTLRFITGTGSKDSYSVSTPTATIGFRGSATDITVEDDGTTTIAQLEDETELCRRREDDGTIETEEERRRRCAVVMPGCSIFVTGAGRDPEELEEQSEKNLAVLRRLPYVRDQRSLVAGFQLDVSACGHFADKGGSLIPLLFIPPVLIIPALPISP
jgi:hypothetical protein